MTNENSSIEIVEPDRLNAICQTLTSVHKNRSVGRIRMAFGATNDVSEVVRATQVHVHT
jgi:hypothetical protein